MTISVLITQCLQHDFVAPVRALDPLPNRLHVGHSEAQRLLGVDPTAGPVAQLMGWSRTVSADQLAVIHIRDWHDPSDPRQREHLQRFGEHCVRDSAGAGFVFGAAKPGETIVDSLILNDVEGTTLGPVLTALRQQHGRLRVGVVGVWTEAKVSFLLYDLKTRFGIDELATCSSLTASASRGQHFNALEQLERILGVSVFASLGDFQTWLAPGNPPVLPPMSLPFGHQAVVVGSGTQLQEADRDIVAWLYRDSSHVELEPLGGGFSGALVFRAIATDPLGQRQAPSVIKLGPSGLIAKERVAFERVEEVLGNRAPTVRGFVDLHARAGIKYSFASMGAGPVRSLKSLIEGGAPVAEVERVLRDVFEEILGPFLAATRYERLPLLEHYGFAAKWATSVRARVDALGLPRAADGRLEFPGGYRVPDPSLFYQDFLATMPPEFGEFRYVCTVHGDLNGANVMIDARDNVWVIDWFHAGPGHVLKDLAKLENDLLYIFTPIADDAALAEALAITTALRAVGDLRAPLPERCPGLTRPELIRAWDLLRVLRAQVARLCKDDRHPLQMSIALMRYAVHTLSFDESSLGQKRWALAAAGGHAKDIQRTMQADRRLRVDWLPGSGPGRVGITLCPGRRDRGRKLDDDLQRLRELGVDRILCLLSNEELAWAGVADLQATAAARGFTFRQEPLLDQAPPSVAEAGALVAWLDQGMREGKTTVVHCFGGLGRAGTIAACLLVHRGDTARRAIDTVRSARGPRAVETPAQEGMVAAFERNRK
ncbi:MAG: phosphotransferase [Planctomycetota bacterium]